MKTPNPKLQARHAKVFDLLRQDAVGQRPADKAAAAAARYLDDATAERMIASAVGSLKTPRSKGSSGLHGLSRLVGLNRRLDF